MPGMKEWKVYSNRKGKEVNLVGSKFQRLNVYNFELFFTSKIFNGNSDTTTPIYTHFDPPIFGNEARILPFSVHPRIVCLRFELHGCRDSSKEFIYFTVAWYSILFV